MLRMNEEEARHFTPTEVLVYQHDQDHIHVRSLVYIMVTYQLSMEFLRSWTVEKLREVIALLLLPEFNPAEIDYDLHKRI